MSRLWGMLHGGPLLPGLLVSAKLYVVTLVINIVVGVTLGLLLARSKLVAAAFEPYIYILYATPTISLVPFVSVIFGFEFGSRVLVSVLISIFPILIGVTEGARSIPRQHLDVAAIFGSNEWQLWRDVIVPYVTPYAMSGIKQSIALSMVGTLVAEFFLNPDGVAAVLLQGTTVVELWLGARRYDLLLHDRGGPGRRRRTDRTVSGPMATYSSRDRSAVAPPEGPGAAHWLTRERVAPAVAGLAMLAVWEIYVRATLPDFVATAARYYHGNSIDGRQRRILARRRRHVQCNLEGGAIGSAAGVVVGVAMGRVREIDWFLSTYIRALYALPLVALVPIVILWVGYQPAARLVIVIISVFLPVAVTTADGTRAIAKDYLDVGKMFGARTHNIWFGIALPSATPFIVAGIELGFARGITNAIAVEVLATVNGMGMSVFTKSNELNENGSLVYVLCLAIFAVGVRSLIIRFRHWLAPWYHR